MKKKIAFINIFKNSVGGGEVYLKRLINNLSLDISHESVLLTPNAPALYDVRCKIINIPGLEINRKYPSFYEIFKTIKYIRKNLQLINPDLVIINGDRAIILSPLFLRKNKAIGIKHMLINSKFKSILNKYAFNKIDRIITISEYHKLNYCSWYNKDIKEKINVIYNPVETTYFNIIKEKSNVLRFIEIATIEERKGQLDLIKAFNKIKSKYRVPMQLHFVGIGNMLTKCQELVKSLNICDSVFFHGYHKDIRNFFSKSNTIFILPSYDEGLPISILEAMSCKTPVISTKIAGIPEAIIDGLNGFIINPGDIESLSYKMEEFLKPGLIEKFGIASRELVKSRFNEKDWIENWKNQIQ